MPELNADLPHTFAYVRNEHLYDLTKGHGEVTPCAIFGVTSVPGRAIGFHVMLDWGAQIDRLPIHALCWAPEAPKQPLHHLELWDCFSVNVAVTQFDYLDGLRCATLLRDRTWYEGSYWCTLDWHGTPYADNPGDGGHKSAHLIKLDNGNFAAQPNNRCRWFEPASIVKPFPERPDLLTNNHVWRAETQTKWATEDSERFFYETDEEEESALAEELKGGEIDYEGDAIKPMLSEGDEP